MFYSGEAHEKIYKIIKEGKYEKDSNERYGSDSANWLRKPKEVHDCGEWPIGRT